MKVMSAHRMIQAAGAVIAVAATLSLLIGTDGSTVAGALSADATSPPRPSEAALIHPMPSDLPSGFRERVFWPRPGGDRDPRDRMWPLSSETNAGPALGGGRVDGPLSREIANAAPCWHTSIRYIVYRSPEEARLHWRKEDEQESIGFRLGSLSGAMIGDACASRRGPLDDLALHTLRHNVSVRISARVRCQAGAKELPSDVLEALEGTAQVIIGRIDTVVKAKGGVGMDNLPPFLVVGVDTVGADPNQKAPAQRPKPAISAPPAPITATSHITLSREDFPASMAERNAFPPQTVRQRLGAPYPYFRLEDTLVAGMGPGPFGGSKVRYVLYRTAESARANWSAEDLTRNYKCSPGSFSRSPLGDACESVYDAPTGAFVLGFIRDRVSVHVCYESRSTAMSDDRRRKIEEVMETTARTILRRIDAVKELKGRVHASNLPKVRPMPRPSSPAVPPVGKGGYGTTSTPGAHGNRGM